MLKKNIALIGYGYWGKILEKYLENNDYFNLKYICDPCIEQHDKYLSNYDRIINDGEIEAVWVSTPISTHYTICKDFLNANKCVMCEKPLVKSTKEVISLKNTAKKNNKILETNFIYTDSPSINFLKKTLPEIGEISFVEMNMRQYGNFYKEDDVYEVIGSHLFSVFFYFFGVNPIDIKYIDILTGENGLVDTGIVLIESNGITVQINISLRDVKKERKFTIYGQKAVVQFDMMDVPNVLLRFLGSNDNITYSFDEKNNIIYAVKRFYDVINRNKKNNIEMAFNVTKLLEMRK